MELGDFIFQINVSPLPDRGKTVSQLDTVALRNTGMHYE